MKIVFTFMMIVALSVSMNANVNIDKMVKTQCKYITDGSNPMMENTYLKGIVEGISYAVPYNDATDLVKNMATKEVMHKACKNALENRTLHGFDADYKWQVMKLSSKKHSKMEQKY